MEKEHLHLLIHEEIYRLPSDEIIEEKDLEVSEVVIAEPSSEPTSDQTDQAEKPETSETEEVLNNDQQVEPESTQETKSEANAQEPVQEENLEELPFAIFHSSSNDAETELLQKIIDACKVPTDQYKIFNNGFDQTIKFKKALVFVQEAKGFYVPIPYKDSEFLCSKPLSQLIQDQGEKAKLWSALQKFVLELK